MQNNQRYFRIGIFVSAAVVLLVGLLFCFGLADEFEKRIHFVTFFSESVQGLSKGSEVKYKGVLIGNVENITILPDAKIIRVDMSIDPKVLRSFKSIKDRDLRLEEIRKFWIRERDAGLCCYLELAGITGQRYIEMDYLAQDKQRSLPVQECEENDAICFASAPSTFNNIIDSVAVSLNKIAQIDLAAISGELENNLKALHRILNDPAISSTLKNLENISQNVDTVSKNLSENLTGADIKTLIGNINANLQSINELTRQTGSKLDSLDVEKLNNLLENTITGSQQLIENMQDGSAEAIHTMQQLNMLVHNLDELVDTLKHDPSSLIRGKTVEPVDFEQQKR